MGSACVCCTDSSRRGSEAITSWPARIRRMSTDQRHEFTMRLGWPEIDVDWTILACMQVVKARSDAWSRIEGCLRTCEKQDYM